MQIPLCLAKNGADVIALSRTQSDLDSLKKEIPDLRTICVDLSNLDEAVKAVEEAGVVHFLVNNTAFAPFAMEFMDTTTEVMRKAMDVNAIAPARLTQIIAKRLIKEDASGAIVNISAAGSHLVASKNALNSVTKSSAVVLAPYKIRVNSVLPGLTKTALVEEALKQSTHPLFDSVLKRTPLKRPAEPKEIADTVAYLLSDKASFITGELITVDGGCLSSMD